MADLTLLRASADNLLVPRAGGLHPPAEVLAAWPRPNYVNPEERGWEAPIVLVVMLFLTIVVFVARLWARLVVSKNAGIDDMFMGISMLPVIGLTVACIKIYGFQWHAWDQTPKTLVTSRQLAMAIELNYMISTSLVKISILFFYRRITGSLTNSFVRWVWFSIVFCAVAGILFTCLIIFTCTPVVGFYRLFDIVWRLKNEVKCHNEGAVIVACAIVGTVQDLVICLLPIFLVWNLRIPRRQKIALCALFGVGLVTCVCGIMRTYYATDVYYSTYDITWYAYYGWIWTALEADLSVICASAPALKVFFKRYLSSTTVDSSVYEISGSHRTPRYGPQSRTKLQNIPTGNSAVVSHIEPEHIKEYGHPKTGITVSQGVDIRVDRDDISQKSFTSTSNLTALPHRPLPKVTMWTTPKEWSQMPDDRRMKDIEHGV